MSIYLDPTGQPTYGIGICARCSLKFFLADLVPDPNDPGLMVCKADRDEFDPYRLAPREPDQIVLPFVRPDTNINTHPAGVIQEAGDEFITTEDGNKYLEMD
jgi:hypothetical protein|tara:strand:- start:1805 stop:2110 length:306 start_codon:yes stop_codon:yes gene_type:complete